jgi:hypothetical protein
MGFFARLSPWSAHHVRTLASDESLTHSTNLGELLGNPHLGAHLGWSPFPQLCGATTKQSLLPGTSLGGGVDRKLCRKDGNGSKGLVMRSYKFVILFEIGGKYRFLDPKSVGNRTYAGKPLGTFMTRK